MFGFGIGVFGTGYLSHGTLCSIRVPVMRPPPTIFKESQTPAGRGAALPS